MRFRNENVLIPNPIEDGFSIAFDNNHTTEKVYGWMMRSDYTQETPWPGAGTLAWDICFANTMGSKLSNNVPRMSSQYYGGTYVDISSHDISIKDTLTTIEYNGYNWYCYYFENTNGCYLQSGNAATTQINNYYTTYMRFIIKPQN